PLRANLRWALRYLATLNYSAVQDAFDHAQKQLGAKVSESLADSRHTIENDHAKGNLVQRFEAPQAEPVHAAATQVQTEVQPIRTGDRYEAQIDWISVPYEV